jgi:hypothetical protein
MLIIIDVYLHLFNIDVLGIVAQDSEGNRANPDFTGEAFETVNLVSSTCK